MTGVRAGDGGRQRDHGFAATARRLLRLVRVHRAFSAMLALGLASITLNIISPILLGRATDLVLAGVLGRANASSATKADVLTQLRVQGHETLATMAGAVDFTPGHGIDMAALISTLLTALLVSALSGVCWMAQGRQATAAIQHAGSRLRAEVEAKLSRLPLTRFDATKRGDLLSRAVNDVDNVVVALQQTMSQLSNSVLLLVGLLTIMFAITPLLAVIAVLVVPVAVVVTTLLGKRAQPDFDRLWAAVGDLTEHVEETYTGHALVTAYDRREPALAEFRERNEAVFRAGYRAQFVSGLSQPSMNFVNNLGYVFVAVVGCLRVASGGLTIGELQAFVQYSRQLSGPLTQVTGLAGVVQSGMASARRVFELLDADEEPTEAEHDRLPGRVAGLVRFESVHFGYDGTPLIEGLSLTARPGRTVAIVGHTGAGKTTLVNLLMRFYDVSGGRITVDGVDTATVPRSDVRANIGMVLQDSWLFAGTIADNIGYGRADATREEIEAAAQAAHADHFVRTLPQGYDTVLGDDGAGVSAGERQLITIARAFLADPPILVLDEATSSVDTRTELLVRRGIGQLSTGRTCFVIAHRLSTIRDADTIVVMSGGAIVESGTHDELLSADGPYAALYRAQFARTGSDAGLSPGIEGV
ncbi:ATP-binding cassette, subfamily B [Amycolatopsis xylanica]|uniref:Fatty acid ABC transporter ATP-binding/permease protein n=1 Tax=Amycolatopsis xylanica TaxID=589385 RepID=A0A1H3SBW8_9PSEU|nr:ABC transporter ATP-binding protein [Amycolatopsis xylanica]SDZ35414.1 ATP-binding cassette, subfamily B [Amycolatopsis xylanica]